MSKSSSKLMLGLGIGSALGGLIGFMANSYKGRKLRHNIYCAAHALENDAKQMLGVAKTKAEKAGAAMADKVANKSQFAQEKVNEWMNK